MRMTKRLLVVVLLLRGAILPMANDVPEAVFDSRKGYEPAEKFLRAGRYEEARTEYRKMLHEAEAKGNDRAGMAKALVRLGTTEFLANRPKAAVQYFERAVGMWEGVPEWQASALNDLAQAQAAIGQWTNAEKALRRAIQLAPQAGRSWYLLGQMHYLRGRTREAEEAYRAALRLADPADSVHIALTLNDLGVLLIEVQKGTEAIGLLERAVAATAPGQAHGRMTANLGSLYWKSGLREKGVQYLQGALAELDGTVGRQHEDTDRVRATYAEMLRDMGRKKEAKAVEAGLASGLR